MTYSLVKQLKDAGFPFVKNECDTPACSCDVGIIDGGWKIPTLEELIEACVTHYRDGKKYRRMIVLSHIPTIAPKGNEPDEAYSYRADGSKSPYLKENRWCFRSAVWGGTAEELTIDAEFYEDTPSEAVANLWLELNKK